MLEKLEKRISEFKKKQDPRYVGVFMFSIFGLVVLIAMNFANVYGREKQISTDSYNRAMYEVITSVNNVDTLVAKVRITMSKEYNIVTLSEITTEATTAKENLAELPVNQGDMRNVSKFFSQVIGYSQTLTKKLANGGNISDDDAKISNQYFEFTVSSSGTGKVDVGAEFNPRGQLVVYDIPNSKKSSRTIRIKILW